MNPEEKEQQDLEAMAHMSEVAAALVSSYRQALLDKGYPCELAADLAFDCSHQFWESFFHRVQFPE